MSVRSKRGEEIAKTRHHLSRSPTPAVTTKACNSDSCNSSQIMSRMSSTYSQITNKKARENKENRTIR